VDRFYAAIKKFDDYLASGEPLHGAAEGLFQGPVADALNHIGQIAMLRRLANSPSKVKTTSSPTSPPAASALSNPPPAANLTDSLIHNQTVAQL